MIVPDALPAEGLIPTWTYHNPVRLRFGVGVLEQLPDLTAAKRTLLLTTAGFSRRGLVARVQKLLRTDWLDVMTDIGPNPELADLEARAASLSQAHAPDIIVAVGGGSVLDTAKVLGALLALRQECFSLRRHLYEDRGPLVATGVPVVAVPTTAGTGSEVIRS